MSQPKLSVIIPVYQVEEYLEECVNSVLNQHFKDYEIILVDDGSKDGCPLICDEYAKKYDSIKVIHKENGGLSSARNAGLEIAQGEFVSFIDSDDYIEKDMFSSMMKHQLAQNADVVICGRYYLYGNTRKIKSHQNVYKTMNNAEAIALMNTNILGYYDVAAWDKIYRKKLFDGIRYPEGKLSEDWYTTYKIFDRANTIVYDSSPKYVYRQREASITHSRKINYSPIEASKEVLDFVKDNYPDYIREAEFAYVYAAIGVIDNIIEQDEIDRNKIFEIRKQIVPYLSRTIKYPGLRGKRKIQAVMVKYCIRLYILVFTKAKAMG